VGISIFKPFCSARTNENVSTPLQHGIRVLRNSSVQHVDRGKKPSDVTEAFIQKLGAADDSESKPFCPIHLSHSLLKMVEKLVDRYVWVTKVNLSLCTL
jgi:hypothetical protein